MDYEFYLNKKGKNCIHGHCDKVHQNVLEFEDHES